MMRHSADAFERRGLLWEPRYSTDFEVRLDGDTTNPEVRGFATVYDYEYPVNGGPEAGGFTEVMARSAFAKSVKDGADVMLLVDHVGLPLARTSSGTLDLRSEDAGLYVRSVLDGRDPDVRALIPKLERGDLNAMSLAFRAIRQQWDDSRSHRVVTEAALYDVSIVGMPANPATVVKKRSVTVEIEVDDAADEGTDTTDYCANCGAELPDGANFCPNCGAAVSTPAGRAVTVDYVRAWLASSHTPETA